MAAGDETAVGTLYDRHGASIMHLAQRILGERADAEEVVVDTFTQAWRGANRFRSTRGSVAAWLIVIARSRALDLARARGRRLRLADSAARQPPELVPGMAQGWAEDEPPPERTELYRHVSSALGALPAEQREAIDLAFWGGLSQSEIADRLGTPLGTVKTRIRAGMQKLRDALRPLYSESLP